MRNRKTILALKANYRAGLILGAVLCGIMFVMIYARAFDTIEFKLLNKAFTKRPPITVNPDIITIDIDDPSLSYAGRWPWSWNIHSMALDFLAMSGARSTTFVDIDFSRKTPLNFTEDSVSEFKRTIQDTAGGQNKAGVPSSLFSDPGTRFYNSIGKNNRAYFSFDFQFPQVETGAKDILRMTETKARLFTTEKHERIALLKEKNSIADKAGHFPVAVDIDPPLREILKSSRGSGFNTISIDTDGVARQYPLLAYYKGDLYPSIGLLAAMRFAGASGVHVTDRTIELQGGKTTIRVPVNKNGEMYINWPGSYTDTFMHVPFNLFSSLIAFQEAKNEAQLYSVATMPDPMALQEILMRKLAGLRIVPEEQCRYISTVVFVSSLIEHYLLNTQFSVEEILAALGVDKSDELFLTLGREIYLNNALMKQYKNSGKVPSFEELLKQASLDLTKETHSQLKEAYTQMVFYIENKMVEKVRPLYFEPGKKLTVGKREVMVSPLFFRDKAVFYGLTATGLTAQHATPFMERHPMLDMVPSVVNTIVTGNFIVDMPHLADYAVSFTYLVIVLFFVLVFGPFRGFLFILLIGLCHGSLAWLAFLKKGIVLPMAPPVFAIAFSYVSALLYRYSQEQKEKKKVRGMFSTMVSPEVLKIMEDNPSTFRLAGEQREATMFSSDVSGFTTISEGVTARELANILNIYLTPMSNIIMSYNGYVDKYEGDAIKADFGVPLPDPNHSWKACFSALYQQEELKVIQRMIFLKYGVRITARMGINTGIVSAGNMGSEKRMQYTVMGDAVTIAEELEPANKLFETWIAIGPETYKQAADYIEVRYLNNLIMGPSHQSLPVYELTGWKKEKYLEFWLREPVPELILESMRKMLPEKVLAYDDYYSRRELPGSQMFTDFKKLFGDLKGSAIEYMKTNNILNVLFIRKALNEITQNLKKHEGLYSGMEIPSHLARDIAKLAEKLASETEDWNTVLLKWRRDLKECLAFQNLLENRIDKNENDGYLSTIDILEKSVECIYKRIRFAVAGDTVALEMSDHLKGLVLDKDGSLFAYQEKTGAEKSKALEKEIQTRLTAFVEGIKNRAEEYHRFIADFCIVTEEKEKTVEMFKTGHQHYLLREWDRAVEVFNAILEIVPDDGPCIMFIKKINELRKGPLPEDWDGAWEE